MNIDSFLDRLEDVTPAGRGWKAICPSHDDREASLGISEGDNGILVNCYAGCTTDRVLEALDLEFRDLFYESTNLSEPEAIYSYTDEYGVELFQAVRLPGKKFRQRHEDPGTGEWVWNLDGVRRVLYRLPEVIAGVAAEKTIYICEGEKDVEALRGVGKVATCNPMGAGKWRDEYAEYLAGAHVIIVADRDEPGRAHADTVKTSLQGIAASIHVVQAARGKDAYDHLVTHGLAVEEFKVRRAAVRRGIVTAAELAEGAVEDLELTAHDIPGYVLIPAAPVVMRQGRMYALGGYTGDGKSNIAIQGTRNLCSAGVRLGYGSLEMPERDLRNRLLAHKGIPMGVLEEPWRIRGSEYEQAYQEGVQEIAAWNLDIVFDSGLSADKLIELAKDREWEAVIIDHVHRFGWGRERRQLESEIMKLTNLALEQNVMVLMLCQLRKQTRGKDMEVYPRPTLSDFRETSQIADDASMALAVWRQRDEAGLRYTGSTQIVVLKNRHTTGVMDEAGREFLVRFDPVTNMIV